MKKVTGILAIIMIGVVCISSCKKDDSYSSGSSGSSINTIVEQGKWRVTLFSDNGTNETNNFSNYEFQFNSNGTLTAVNGSTTVNGNWSSAYDDSHNKLVLNFATTFSEISDDWVILEQTSTQIRLQDDSGGGSGTELLTFQKI